MFIFIHFFLFQACSAEKKKKDKTEGKKGAESEGFRSWWDEKSKRKINSIKQRSIKKKRTGEGSKKRRRVLKKRRKSDRG